MSGIRKSASRAISALLCCALAAPTAYAQDSWMGNGAPPTPFTTGYWSHDENSCSAMTRVGSNMLRVGLTIEQGHERFSVGVGGQDAYWKGVAPASSSTFWITFINGGALADAKGAVLQSETFSQPSLYPLRTLQVYDLKWTGTIDLQLQSAVGPGVWKLKEYRITPDGLRQEVEWMRACRDPQRPPPPPPGPAYGNCVAEDRGIIGTLLGQQRRSPFGGDMLTGRSCIPPRLKTPLATVIHQNADLPADYIWGGNARPLTVRFEIDVSAIGMPAACRVTGSSGSALLDAGTCRVLERRIRFIPAKDADGHEIASRYRASWTWEPH